MAQRASKRKPEESFLGKWTTAINTVADARKRETLVAEGWRPETHDNREWWYYLGVGKGWSFDQAWKRRAIYGKRPAQPEDKREAAREAVIRAAKAWAALELTPENRDKALRRAVARLEKLEAK